MADYAIDKLTGDLGAVDIASTFATIYFGPIYGNNNRYYMFWIYFFHIAFSRVTVCVYAFSAISSGNLCCSVPHCVCIVLLI